MKRKTRWVLTMNDARGHDVLYVFKKFEDAVTMSITIHSPTIDSVLKDGEQRGFTVRDDCWIRHINSFMYHQITEVPYYKSWPWGDSD